MKAEQRFIFKGKAAALGRRMAYVCLLAMVASWLLGMSLPPSAAKPTKTPKSKGSGSSAYDVIATVNQVRAANGLAALQSNGALMAAAQAHSAYQASIGSASHSGSGGSDPKGRAVAAGYGGGSGVSVTENIYAGANASAQQAVTWWQGDSLHLNTLLSAKAVDVGAGVAEGNGVVYYTLDVGYIVGGSSSSSGSTTGAVATSGSGATTASTAVAYSPLALATPGADGSIVHVVQNGQTLWVIAAAYNIPLPDLLSLNHFTSGTYIFPGDSILIRAAQVEATPAGTSTPEIVASLTSRPTKTPVIRPAETQPAQLQPTVAKSAAAQKAPTALLVKKIGKNLAWLLIAALVGGGTLLLVVGNLLKRGA